MQKILIDMQEGVIQNVYTSQDAQIIVIDRDRKLAGSGVEFLVSEIEPTETNRAIYKIFKDYEDEEVENQIFELLKEKNF